MEPPDQRLEILIQEKLFSRFNTRESPQQSASDSAEWKEEAGFMYLEAMQGSLQAGPKDLVYRQGLSGE